LHNHIFLLQIKLALLIWTDCRSMMMLMHWLSMSMFFLVLSCSPLQVHIPVDLSCGLAQAKLQHHALSCNNNDTEHVCQDEEEEMSLQLEETCCAPTRQEWKETSHSVKKGLLAKCQRPRNWTSRPLAFQLKLSQFALWEPNILHSPFSQERSIDLVSLHPAVWHLPNTQFLSLVTRWMGHNLSNGSGLNNISILHAAQAKKPHTHNHMHPAWIRENQTYDCLLDQQSQQTAWIMQAHFTMAKNMKCTGIEPADHLHFSWNRANFHCKNQTCIKMTWCKCSSMAKTEAQSQQWGQSQSHHPELHTIVLSIDCLPVADPCLHHSMRLSLQEALSGVLEGSPLSSAQGPFL